MTPRPTHLLRHEHRVIEQVLRALDGICLRLNTGSDVPAQALAQTLDFIRNFADRHHHHREEAFLFPVLEQCGFDDGRGLHFLREEHQLERELTAELELAIEEYRYGDARAAQRFVEAAGRFCRHLIAHMQKEDALLFRMAEDLLDEAVKNELMRNLAQMSSDEGCANSPQQYECLAEQLEREWAI